MFLHILTLILSDIRLFDLTSYIKDAFAYLFYICVYKYMSIYNAHDNVYYIYNAHDHVYCI